MFFYATAPHPQVTPHQQLTLTDGIRSASLTFSEDQATLKKALERLAPMFKKEAVGAHPALTSGKTVTIVPGSFARALNVTSTAQRVRDALQKDPTMTRFMVVLDKTPPDLTAEKLQKITGILGQFTTQTSAQTKRNHNIALAVESVDGTLLSPGETFSLNEIVGRRTQARGYRTATVFVNAEKVPGVGGGVSQVTGTLFNAAALAGIRIVEVNPHSRPVSYLPLGRDATVAFGDKDLRFTNTTSGSVYIGYSFVGQTLQATLWGAPPPGRTVTLTPVVNRRSPGHIDAELYRTIKQDGKVIQKERLLRHTYRWKPK
jgi:vancomycin resistance protein YoaR